MKIKDISLIITEPTDQHKVKFGYCLRCGSYNEVWRQDKTTQCMCCNRTMIHISSWKISVFAIIMIGLILFII